MSFFLKRLPLLGDGAQVLHKENFNLLSCFRLFSCCIGFAPMLFDADGNLCALRFHHEAHEGLEIKILIDHRMGFVFFGGKTTPARSSSGA
jgi:hypothetical protein